MSYEYKDIFLRMPRSVKVADITIRDGLQHLEKRISTEAKIYYAEEMIFAGCRDIELTNLGSTYLMPQFSDGEKVLAYFRSERFLKKCLKRGINPNDITFTAVTIREKAVDRAIELTKNGVGPDRLLMMVSTEEQHHFTNSGTTLPEYWKEAERCIKKCNDNDMLMCGTVSTIWGSPITGKTDPAQAIDFAKRWLEIGAHDIEHADHDGSASAPDIFKYFSKVLDEMPDPKKHIAHFHETKRVASASILAALQAGITNFEATLGGLGGQPTTFFEDRPVRGTGDYYYKDPRYVGLVCMEDTLVQISEMGIETGYDIDRVLCLGKMLEKTVGFRLRSEAMVNGRTSFVGHPEFSRPALYERKMQLSESRDQLYPEL